MHVVLRRFAVASVLQQQVADGEERVGGKPRTAATEHQNGKEIASRKNLTRDKDNYKNAPLLQIMRRPVQSRCLLFSFALPKNNRYVFFFRILQRYGH